MNNRKKRLTAENSRPIYAEVEQASFKPINIVEGIGYSPDEKLKISFSSRGKLRSVHASERAIDF